MTVKAKKQIHIAQAINDYIDDFSCLVFEDPVDIEVKITLGDDVRVASADIETRLLGGITINAKPNEVLQAAGSERYFHLVLSPLHNWDIKPATKVTSKKQLKKRVLVFSALETLLFIVL